MDLHTGSTGLQNSITNQPQSNITGGDGRIGARINARISKDLGGGKYIINLGGSETMFVESEAKFRENEQVNVELRSTSEGRVELKILSRQTSENATINSITTADSAVLTKDIQISLPTSSLTNITGEPQSQPAESTTNAQSPDHQPATLEIAENITGKDTPGTPETTPATGAAAPKQPANEIQLIISRDENSSQPATVKILLPDGNIIEAELVTDKTEAQLSSETVQNSKLENSLKDIIFNNNPAADPSQESTSTQATAETDKDTASIRKMLSAIAARLFAREETAGTPATLTDNANTIRMLLKQLTLPLELITSEAESGSPAANLPPAQTKLDLILPYTENADSIRDILNSLSKLSISQNDSGDYSLAYSTSNGGIKQLPLPQDTAQRLQQLIPQSTGTNITIPVELGVKSLLQGIIQESISSNSTLAAQADNSGITRPQDDNNKLDSLLRRNGMTPSTANREAARALLDNTQPISRENISSLLALSAGKSGEARLAFLNAGARLLSLDAPLSPALASGMSRLLSNETFISSIDKIETSLSNAEDTVKNIPTDIESETQSKSGRDIRAMLAKATQTLKGIPVLIETLNTADNIDLSETKGQSGNSALAKSLADFISTSARERLGTVENLIQNSAQDILSNDPILSRISKALDTILSKIGNLPYDVHIEKNETAPTPQDQQSTPEDNNTDKTGLAKIRDAISNDLTRLNPKELNQNVNEMLKDLLGSKDNFTHPGINRLPEFWQKVEVDSSTLQNADLSKIKDIIEKVLTATSPEKAQEITRELLRTTDRDTLRTLAGTLQEIEKDEIQKHPALQSLREASNELRELGRALIAQKTENLATSRNDPASFNTSIPFNFNNEDGSNEDGKLSMFYNRSKNKGGKWQQRVILDLNMTMLGNVIGDIQFHEGMINVNFATSSPQTVNILESEKEGLLTGLTDLGFAASVGVRLIIPETPKDSSRSERTTDSRHILDIKA